MTKTEYHNFHFLMLDWKTEGRIEVKEDLEKKEAIKAWQRITSEEKPKMLEWIPNNELQIRPWRSRSSTSYSRRMESSFELEKWTCGISTCSNAKKRFVIPRKFVAIFKLSQKNCVFLIWKRYINQIGVPRDPSPGDPPHVLLCLSDTRRCGTQQCRPDKRNWKKMGRHEIVHEYLGQDLHG